MKHLQNRDSPIPHRGKLRFSDFAADFHKSAPKPLVYEEGDCENGRRPFLKIPQKCPKLAPVNGFGALSRNLGQNYLQKKSHKFEKF